MMGLKMGWNFHFPTLHASMHSLVSRWLQTHFRRDRELDNLSHDSSKTLALLQRGVYRVAPAVSTCNLLSFYGIAGRLTAVFRSV